MKLSQNSSQRLALVLFLALDTYRVLIGSFYSIFVPQSCPDHKYPLIMNGTAVPMTYHTCTLKDNVSDLTTYNKAVIGLNALTALCMAVAFVIETRRENWIIKHLDVDSKKADDNLKTEIVAYDRIKASLLKKNKQYMIAFYTVSAFNVMNLITSAVLVADYFDGLKTITTFLTNALLIVLRISKSIKISRTCEHEMKAQSVFLSEPTTFNTIDPKYQAEGTAKSSSDTETGPCSA